MHRIAYFRGNRDLSLILLEASHDLFPQLIRRKLLSINLIIFLQRQSWMWELERATKLLSASSVRICCATFTVAPLPVMRFLSPVSLGEYTLRGTKRFLII